MSKASIDRLMVLTLSGSQSGALLKELNSAGFQFTDRGSKPLSIEIELL